MRRVRFLALLAGVTLAGCSSGGSPGADTPINHGGGTTTEAPASAATAGQGCRTDFTPRPLPTWANAGFQPPSNPMPYVLGDNGDIVAILWADHDPLVVPPDADRNNKILWVPRVRSADRAPLQIRARLAGSRRTATRTVEGGPGPSIVDLPAAGCWTFDLTWGDHHDRLRLEYAAA